MTVRERRGEYSPINKSAKQILQTILTGNINKATNNFFNLGENPRLLQYNTTNKGSRHEILDDQGERRGEKRESTIFNTTNKGLCSMSNDDLQSRTFPQRDGNVGKRNHQVVKRKNEN